MFGLISKKKHDEIVARQNRDIYYQSDLIADLRDELDDLRAFKAKVMKGLNAANAKRKAEREAA